MLTLAQTARAGQALFSVRRGGKTRFGHRRKPPNQYLKWAFIEAAKVVVRHRHHPAWKTTYVCQIYDQVSQRKGHAVAVGAVARPLAEGAFWILKRQQPYRPPALRQASPKQVRGRAQHVPNEVRGPWWPERLLIARHLLDVLMPLDGATRSRVVGGVDVPGQRPRVLGGGEPALIGVDLRISSRAAP
jgi:hypothetical protein